MRIKIKKAKFPVLCLFTFALLLGSSCAGPKFGAKKSPIKRPVAFRKDVVNSIEFEGNYKYKDKTLLKKLGFEAGDYYDHNLGEEGRATIEDHYRKKGFAYVRVMLLEEQVSEGREEKLIQDPNEKPTEDRGAYNIIYKVDEGPRVGIKSISFRGNKAIKTSSLKKALQTRKRKWLFWPGYYNKEKVDADVERLKSIYYNNGFLNHNIWAEGTVHVIFIIEEGPAYTIDDINFPPLKHFDDKTLRAELELEPGQIYNKRKADSHARRILKLLRENGYINAAVEQRPDYDPEAGDNVVNVEYDITEGKQFRIGRIDITGNNETQDRVVRRILDEEDFTPGALYNADIAPRMGGGQLEKYIRRTVLCEDVIIQPVDEPYIYNPDAPNEVTQDVGVEITEGFTGMWNPGVGVSSDSGVIGQLIFQQRNFDIKDKPESLGDLITMKAFKGAGQTLRIALEPGTEVSRYSISFHEPYFRDRPTSLDVTGSSWERWRESYDENRLKGFFGFEQRRKDRWRRSIGFRAENVGIDDLDDDAPQEIIDVEGDNLLAGIRFGIGRDLTDDRFNPSRGTKFNTQYEQVSGDHNFGILSGTHIWYSTLHEDLLERKTILAIMLRGASVVGDAPPFEKFYGGGTGTYGIRGFDYRGVSPRAGNDNDPIGSDWIFLANTEVVVPLASENFAALFFVDGGAIDTGGYRASVGTGIQILIPQWFGPVPMRFEIATPFMKDDQDETAVFSFSMGALF